jgi:hypothetical protein
MQIIRSAVLAALVKTMGKIDRVCERVLTADDSLAHPLIEGCHPHLG